MIEDCSSESTEVNIIERLEKLNKWQEEQKTLLQERQNKQRELLGIEQKTIYQMMGLLNNTDKLDTNIVQEIVENRKEKTPDEKYDKEENFEEHDQNKLPNVLNLHQEKKSKDSLKNLEFDLNRAENSILEVPKRQFLKRGEGLKQRFKIDPETLRINNLPPYKYAKSKRVSSSVHTSKTSQKVPKELAKSVSGSKLKLLPPLNAQEKRFQHLLISSKTVCNSTPDLKSSLSIENSNFTTHKDIVDQEDQNNSCSERKSSASPYSLSPETNIIPITWSKVLDTKNIEPISLKQIRPNSKGCDAEHDDSNLSIFELLEQKCNEGPLDMNFTPIKRFLKDKYRSKLNDNDEIIVDDRLKNAGINPKIVDVINEQNYYVNEESTKNDLEDTTWDELQNSVDDDNVKQKQHVRFIDEIDNNVSHDKPSEASTLINDYSVQQDFFQQFKEALFFALHNKTAQIDDDESNASTLAPVSATSFTKELQEKTNLVKFRLEELEKEIAAFKENNAELIRAKQDLEQEKLQFQKDQTELLDQIKDEKIQIEIYLHDERMKIEDEKRKFEEKMRMQKSSTSSKERKEIARLKHELEDMKTQYKQKEHDHTTAQARIRAQMRVLEKDQKQLYEEIDRLNKENKKLQNENLRLNNDSNKKMLQEINKNIAKLTPKLTTPNANIEENDCKNKNVKRKSHMSKNNVKKPELCKPQRFLSNMRVKVTEQTATEFLSESSQDEEFVDLKKNGCTYYNITDLNQIPPADGPNKSMSEPSPHIAGDTGKDFKREIINSDGSRDIWYPNGNVKKISADGLVTRMLYYNKDIKETNINQGTVKYYYAETNTWHTTYLDGLEILEFPNGQTEHRHKDGVVEVHFPNNSVKIINPLDEQHLEEWRFVDGTNLIKMRNGDKIILLPNGQKEIHTKLNKRREYPDGTVKLVYPDGSQETRYSNGRIRLKDKDGNLVMDSEC